METLITLESNTNKWQLGALKKQVKEACDVAGETALKDGMVSDWKISKMDNYGNILLSGESNSEKMTVWLATLLNVNIPNVYFKVGDFVE